MNAAQRPIEQRQSRFGVPNRFSDAIVLFAVAVISAMAFTGGDSGTPIMTMSDGSTMPTDRMSTP